MPDGEAETEFLYQKRRIKPETGKLVCFPSYLLHNAGVNMSNRDRISIAFNGDINDGSFM